MLLDSAAGEGPGLKHVLKLFVGSHDFTRFTRQGAYAERNDPSRLIYRLHAVGNVHAESEEESLECQIKSNTLTAASVSLSQKN